MKRLLLAGGGTGGHLFPAMAVGEAWREAFGAEAELLFVGTAGRIEARAVPEAGERFEAIEVSGIVGLRGWRKLLGLMRLPLALFQAIGIVRRFSPDLVLGAGGFASGPTVLAAWLLGVPTALLEQNAMPGVTNRILAKFTRRIFTHFSQCEAWFPAHKIRRLGNPVRAAQLKALQETQAETRDSKQVNLLVMGGSQGSKALNDDLPPALAELSSDLRQQLNIVHQCGRQGEPAEIEKNYLAQDLRAQVLPFMSNMAARYAWSDLCICRSGAMTVSEMAIAGKPAIFVPFPQATHDHQTENARELVACGAAVLMAQKDLKSKLGLTLAHLLHDRAVLLRMGEAAAAAAKPQAARNIVGELADLLGVGDEVAWA
jgi:UDP-N-acetylglucosamine--N-acetylmuramyl-(pentapeptide) pyrophosphoryl-undecaprenol N-acetylglucosamine transferase